MGLVLETNSYYDNSGGVDLQSSATKVAEDNASLTLNIDYSTDGAFFTRNGSTIMNVDGSNLPAKISGAPKILNFYDYKNSNGNNAQVIVAGTKIYHSLTSPTAQVTGLTADTMPDLEFLSNVNNDYLLFGNGVDTNRKYDGSSWTNLSLPRPTAPTLVDAGGGGSTTGGDYYFYYSYGVISSGVIIQEGELSPKSALLTIVANNKITVTVANSSDSQVNAKIIYVINNTTGKTVRVTSGATISDNTTTTYTFNLLNTDLSTIEASFDNQAAPISAIIEANDYGEVFYVDAAHPTNYYVSLPYYPWNVPTISLGILDGPIRCMKRCFGAMIFGTDKSLWVQAGDSTVAPRRISSHIGILNNRCAVGEDTLYILATNFKFYQISPTDFSQQEMRLSDSISDKISPILETFGGINVNQIFMCYYTRPNVAKVMISCAPQVGNNNEILVYNEQQSIKKQYPVWQFYDNINANSLAIFNVNGVINLYSGDYNGFIWKLDDPTRNGDGAEENGTITSATSTILTDSTQAWTVNAFVGMIIRITGGTGENQIGTISSNTATTVTISVALTTALDTTSTYTIGGYDVYHYSNWKFVLNSYDAMKQLWFIWSNLNASGDYNIKLILQFDFDTSIANQTNLLVNLKSENTIWGAFNWGEADWGSRSVFEDRIRQFARFKAMRVGFYNRNAGQPFQCNGFSLSAQEKGLYYAGN